jgi:hypothetical protein
MWWSALFAKIEAGCQDIFYKFLKNFGNGDVTGRRNKGMPMWNAFLRAFGEAGVPAATG